MEKRRRRSLKIDAHPKAWHLLRKLLISRHWASSGRLMGQVNTVAGSVMALTLCFKTPSSRRKKDINPASPAPGPPCSCPGQQSPWKQLGYSVKAETT